MATLARWNAAAIDDAGNKMDGCSVEVRRESDNGLASVFSDRAGAVSLGNPFTAADGGNIGFHVVGSSGGYKITATLGAVTRTWRYVGIGLGSESDGGGGDVVGPASAVDDTPMVADGATGKLIKNKTYAAFKTLLVLVKGDVGLGNVDNTSDVGKPVSTATQTALDLKANLASPTFTGVPAGPTAAPGTNTTQFSTTAFVKAAIDVVLGGVAGAFDTLFEIATDLGLKMVKTANLSDVANAATARTNLGVQIGLNVQAWAAKLDAIVALTWAADKLAYFTSASAVATTDLTSVARTLIAQTTQALMRTTGLGLGDVATESIVPQSKGGTGRAEVAAAAGSMIELSVRKTGIADNVATAMITVTVPNGNHNAVIALNALAHLGAGTDASESTRGLTANLAIARTTGVATALSAVSAGQTAIATIAGGGTLTLTVTASAISGAVGATQTFDIMVTLVVTGTITDHVAMIYARLLNSAATGVTMAAA